MEARFTRLEALVISMVAQVKYITSRPRKAKDREYDQSCGQMQIKDSFVELVFVENSSSTS
jgi:hypothetical protein